jgi:hypothetical protein
LHYTLFEYKWDLIIVNHFMLKVPVNVSYIADFVESRYDDFFWAILSYSSWGNSDRWWVYRMRPDIYVLCPSMELIRCVWIVIRTVETVFRYLFLNSYSKWGICDTLLRVWNGERFMFVVTAKLLLSADMWVNLFSVWFETYRQQICWSLFLVCWFIDCWSFPALQITCTLFWSVFCFVRWESDHSVFHTILL